jgi:hypothetical protein
VRRVVLASPEHKADIPVAFKRDGADVTFTVPSIATYEIADVVM